MPTNARIKDMVNGAAAVIRRAEISGDPVLILRHSRPVAVLVAIDTPLGRDIVLALASDVAQALTQAEQDRLHARGELWESLPWVRR